MPFVGDRVSIVFATTDSSLDLYESAANKVALSRASDLGMPLPSRAELVAGEAPAITGRPECGIEQYNVMCERVLEAAKILLSGSCAVCAFPLGCSDLAADRHGDEHFW